MSVSYVFLDSGIGGLPYLKRLKQLAPNASCAYVADTAHFPYGEKTSDEVRQFSAQTVKRIIQKLDPKIIVVACNTMSVSALEYLRITFPQVKFVGTFPAIKPAYAVSQNKRIGILATERTIKHAYTENLIKTYGNGCEFYLRADPTLVRQIEDNFLTATKTEQDSFVKPALDYFQSQQVDTIVLACTHFLHLKNNFIRLGAPDIQIIDSVEGVVKQTLQLIPTDFIETSNDELFYITSKLSPDDQAKYQQYTTKFNLELAQL